MRGKGSFLSSHRSLGLVSSSPEPLLSSSSSDVPASTSASTSGLISTSTSADAFTPSSFSSRSRPRSLYTGSHRISSPSSSERSSPGAPTAYRQRSTAIFGSDSVLALIGPPGPWKPAVLQLLAMKYAPGLVAHAQDLHRIMINKELPVGILPDELPFKDSYRFDVFVADDFWQWQDCSFEGTSLGSIPSSLLRLATADGFLFVCASSEATHFAQSALIRRLIQQCDTLRGVQRPKSSCFVQLALCETAEEAATARSGSLPSVDSNIAYLHCPMNDGAQELQNFTNSDDIDGDVAASIENTRLSAEMQALDELLGRMAVDLLRKELDALPIQCTKPVPASGVDAARHSEFIDTDSFLWSKKFAREAVPMVRAATLEKLLEHLVSPQVVSHTVFTFLVTLPSFALRYEVFAALEAIWNSHPPSQLSPLSLSSSTSPTSSPMTSPRSPPASRLFLTPSSPSFLSSSSSSSSTATATSLSLSSSVSSSLSITSLTSSVSCSSLPLSSSPVGQGSKAVRSRLLSVLRQWIGHTDYFADATLTYQLNRFLVANQLQAESRTLVQNMFKQYQQQMDESKQPRRNSSQVCPKPLLPKKPRTIGKALRFLDIPPQEAARQLTLIDFATFSTVGTLEWCKAYVGGKKGRESLDNVADRIRTLVRQFNDRVAWFSFLILEPQDAAGRAQVIKHLIKVATYLLDLRSFSALLAISASLESVHVHRLTRSWEQVSKQQLHDYVTYIKPVCTPASNYQAMRDLIDTLNPPLVPYIGVYLSDLTFIQDGNPATVAGGLINFEKCIMAGRVVGILQTLQRATYALEEVPSIMAYFQSFSSIKQPEHELYRLSLLREPRLASSNPSPLPPGTTTTPPPTTTTTTSTTNATTTSTSTSTTTPTTTLTTTTTISPSSPAPSLLSSFEVLSNLTEAETLFAWLIESACPTSFSLLVFFNHCFSLPTTLPFLRHTFRTFFLSLAPALLKPLFKRVVSLAIEQGAKHENVRYEVLVFFRYCLVEPPSSHFALFQLLSTCPIELLANDEAIDQTTELLLGLLVPTSTTLLNPVTAALARLTDLTKQLARARSRRYSSGCSSSSSAEELEAKLHQSRLSSARVSLALWLGTTVPTLRQEVFDYLDTSSPVSIPSEQAELSESSADALFLPRFSAAVVMAQAKHRSGLIAAYSSLNTALQALPTFAYFDEHISFLFDWATELVNLLAKPPPVQAGAATLSSESVADLQLRGRAAYLIGTVIFAEIEQLEPCVARLTCNNTTNNTNNNNSASQVSPAALQRIADLRGILMSFYSTHPLFTHVEMLDFDKSVAKSMWSQEPYYLIPNCKAPALSNLDEGLLSSSSSASLLRDECFSLSQTCYEWPSTRVCSWLTTSGFSEQYASIFAQHSINGLDLLHLTYISMVLELGISDEKLWTAISDMQDSFRESVGQGELLLLALNRQQLLQSSVEQQGTSSPAPRRTGDRRLLGRETFKSLPNILAASSDKQLRRDQGKQTSVPLLRPRDCIPDPNTSAPAPATPRPASSEFARLVAELPELNIDAILAHAELAEEFRQYLRPNSATCLSFLQEVEVLSKLNDLAEVIARGRKLYAEYLAPNASVERVYVETEEDSIFMELFGNFLTSPEDVISLFEFSLEGVRERLRPAAEAFAKSLR